MISRANGNNSRGHSDHHQRMQVLLGHVHNAKHAGILQVEAEHQLSGAFGLALDRQRHFELVFGEVVGGDVDLDVDRRLLLLGRQRGRRVRIFERQVLVYCANTLSWGGAWSAGAPLPLVIEVSPGRGAVGANSAPKSLVRFGNCRYRREWLS